MGSADGPVQPQPAPPADVDEISMGDTSSDSDESMLCQWGWHNGEWKEQKPGINGYYMSKWNHELGRFAEDEWVWHEPSTDAPEPLPAQIPNLPDHDPEDDPEDDSDEDESGCPVV